MKQKQIWIITFFFSIIVVLSMFSGCLNDINLESIKETRDKIQELFNVDILLAEADISNEEQVDIMRKKVYQKFENVFLLVNNAGIRGGSSSLKTKTKDYDRVMGVNVKGAWNVTKAFYRKMARQKFEPVAGKIINITSCAGTECGLNPLNHNLAAPGCLLRFVGYRRENGSVPWN